jgi:hypothetical protein
MINREGLLTWYQQQTKQKKNPEAHVVLLFNAIWFYAMTLTLLILFVFGLMALRYRTYNEDLRYATSMEQGNMEYAKALKSSLIADLNFSMFEVTVLLFFLTVAFYVHVVAKLTINRFELMREKKLVLPNTSPNSLVRKLIEEVAGRMKIPTERLFVWKVVSQQLFPSIEESKDGSIHLIVPPSFHSYAKNDSQKAAGVIAHELGHVLQSDALLYPLSLVYFRIVRPVFFPLVVFGVLTGAFGLWTTGLEAAYSLHVLFFGLNFLVLVSLAYGFYRVSRDRKRSDVLADAASVLYSGNDNILEVLKELDDASGRSGFSHPGPFYRFAVLQRLISKFKSA